MPAGGDPPKAGLGTNLVAALARGLDADVETIDATPGVRVSITHRKPAWMSANNDAAIDRRIYIRTSLHYNKNSPYYREQKTIIMGSKLKILNILNYQYLTDEKPKYFNVLTPVFGFILLVWIML